MELARCLRAQGVDEGTFPASHIIDAETGEKFDKSAIFFPARFGLTGAVWDVYLLN